MHFSAVYKLRRYLMAFRRQGASKKGGVWKFNNFLSLTVNISKTVADTAKVIINVAGSDLRT